jgi:hypothetical protein
MATYKIIAGGITFIGIANIFPNKIDGDYAVRGQLDVPKRKGDTEKVWDDEIEPFVSSSDIEFDERIFEFSIFCVEKNYWQNFVTSRVNQQFAIETPFGDFDYCWLESAELTEVNSSLIVDMKIRVWDVYSITSKTFDYTVLSGMKIDNVYLKTLDIYLKEKPRFLDVNELVYDMDFFKSSDYGKTQMSNLNKRKSNQVDFEFIIKYSDLADLITKWEKFIYLIANEGLRTVVYDGATYTMYLTDGIKIRNIRGGFADISFSLKNVNPVIR